MNTKVTSPGLIPTLYAKYKTDLFLFINQLDIVSNQLAAGDIGAAAERVITLHYTVFTVDAKEINSGICSVKLPLDVNTPAKITSGYVSKIGVEITRRIALALSKIEVTLKK